MINANRSETGFLLGVEKSTFSFCVVVVLGSVRIRYGTLFGANCPEKEKIMSENSVAVANKVQVVDVHGVVHFLRQGQPLADLMRSIREN
jgi:hypothetical protein